MHTNEYTMVYPLSWPDGRARTPMLDQRESRFAHTLAEAIKKTSRELVRLGASHVVITCNVAGAIKRGVWRPYVEDDTPDDPGTAIYFTLDSTNMCLTCDRWTFPEDNIHAIGLTVGAMRGIARWGSSETMKRAFSGFKSLPPTGNDWRSVLGIRGSTDYRAVKSRYKELSRAAHPDLGGNPQDMVRLNEALEQAQCELGQSNKARTT